VADEKILTVRAELQEREPPKPAAGEDVRREVLQRQDDFKRTAGDQQQDFTRTPTAGETGQAAAEPLVSNAPTGAGTGALTYAPIAGTGPPAAAAGGAGGAIPPVAAGVAGAAAGAGGGGPGPLAALGAAAGAAAGALTTTAATATVVVTGLVALGIAIVSTTELLEFLYDRLTKEFEDISPAISVARAQQEVALIQQRIQTERLVAQTATEVIAQQTAVQKELIELRAHISNVIAPFLKIGLKFEEYLAYIANFIFKNFEEVRLGNELNKEMIAFGKAAAEGNIAEAIRHQRKMDEIIRLLKGEEDPNSFQKQAIDFLSGDSNKQMFPELSKPLPRRDRNPRRP
jgi:hypothetical protein